MESGLFISNYLVAILLKHDLCSISQVAISVVGSAPKAGVFQSSQYIQPDYRPWDSANELPKLRLI